MTQFLQQIVNGLSIGSIYALIALGYTMVYGIIKLINFAHGDIYMVGAFVGFICISTFKMSVLSAILCAMVFCALLGVAVERLAYKPLRNPTKAGLFATALVMGFILIYLVAKATLELDNLWAGVIALVLSLALGFFVYFTITPKGNPNRIAALITAIGVSFFLEYAMMAIMGPNNRSYPATLGGTATLAGVQITFAQILIFIITLALMLILTFIVQKTKIGRAMRAVSTDADAAALMGVNVDRTISITFAIGSSLAGAAGVLVGIYYNTLNPLMGMTYGLKAFIAAVFGGIGIIPGAMLGGFAIGITETMVAGYWSSLFKDAIVYIILIVILILKPSGLLGKNVREKV
ncbi:MAG: branched-chain amino acid ABC transporter permease [Erysipelotrichaceae bacterium]|jgi:branched-chain amino acid transport system permease protein|nr:branched-chain amino acid ABC transporter permease [Erysipelotrichaceae bacterium]